MLTAILMLLAGVGVFIAGMNMLSQELERVADHLVNVGYSVLNPTGSQSEAQQEAAKA